MPLPSIPPASVAEVTRCLVVDDDPMVRRTLGRILAREGLTAVEAEDGEQALALLHDEPSIPLIVTDLHMPRLDGLGLLREACRRHPDAAVLVVTGVAEVKTAVECLQAGAMDYLSKPLLVEEVLSRVRNALEKRRLTLENRWLQQRYRQELEDRLAELGHRNQEMFLGQIQMAVRMLEAKDEYTRGHSQRVARYSLAIGRMLGLDSTLLDQIKLGGELHDIGKIGTRDAVLNKAGPLTDEEFEEIKRHVLVGEEILEPLRRDHPAVLEIVRYHHEHLNGRGFPDHLAGDAIPFVARIVSVADAFDAMTTSRAYRAPRPIVEALGELDRCVGTQFDPMVVGAFHRAFPDPAQLPIAPG